MDRISGLSDELLVKILSFLPTKVAVSTSILSKQWEFLWMWLPNLEYDDTDFNGPASLALRDFVVKNLPLHRAAVIEGLHLRFCSTRLFKPEYIKLWVGIAVSRCVRELSINLSCFGVVPADVSLPISLYTCNSLMTLKLEGQKIFVDVPRTVYLPSLKTLHLRCVTYLSEDSLRLLLSYCPILQDLCIERDNDYENVGKLVVNIPSLQRLSLQMNDQISNGYVIVTPSLKYFKFEDFEEGISYLVEDMPKLEEADISVVYDIEKFLGSITSVKRLSLGELSTYLEENVYPVGIVFNQLEHLKLRIHSANWSKLLVWLLRNSPKLRVLNLYVDHPSPQFNHEYHPVKWKNNRRSVPECFRKSLETFEFVGYMGTQEERDFLSFFFKHACCLKSTSIIHGAAQLG